MADRLNWSHGKPGKGMVLSNGDIHTWPVDHSTRDPHHGEYWSIHNLTSQPAEQFFIAPDGSVTDEADGSPSASLMGKLQLADPNLHSPQPKEDWALDPSAMPEKDMHGPDFNYILSHDESDGWSAEGNDDFAVMLKNWLDNLPGQAVPATLSPHHRDVQDIIPQATLSPSDATSLYPPGHEPDWLKQGADGPKEPYPDSDDGDPEVARPGEWVIDEETVVKPSRLTRFLRRRR